MSPRLRRMLHSAINIVFYPRDAVGQAGRSAMRAAGSGWFLQDIRTAGTTEGLLQP